MAESGQEHLRGFFGDLASFVDQDCAVFLRAEAGPVGEVPEVDS